MPGFKHAILTKVLNPEEPDPALQNVVVMRKWNAIQRTKVASLSTPGLDIYEAQQAIRDGRNPKLAVNPFVKRLETLKAVLIEWRGPLFMDEQGKPIPCTPAMIDDLDDDLFDQLADEAERLVQGLTDDEKKTSQPPMSDELSEDKLLQFPDGMTG